MLRLTPERPTQERMNAPAPITKSPSTINTRCSPGALHDRYAGLVRLPMLQRVRDLAAGLNTAGSFPGIAARRSADST